MCGPDIPEPPSPQETSAAQTGSGVSTAMANSYLGAVNRITPDGSLTYQFGDVGQYNPVDQSQFNADWYLQQNPDVAQNWNGDPWSHFEQHGRGEGRSPYEGYEAYTGGDPGGYQEVTDPYTGQTYRIPRITATTTLSPEGERLRGLNNETRTNLATAGRDASDFLGGYLGNRLTPDNLPARRAAPNAPNLTKTYGTDWSQDRRRVEDAIMGRLNPQLDRDRAAMQTRLANQGITPGSEAWSREVEAFNRGSNDARTSAILAGGQEQSRLAGLARDRASFENMAAGQGFESGMALADLSDRRRTQGTQEAFAYRNQPINEIIALLSGSQVNTPNFGVAQPSRIPTTDVAGNIWNNYNQRKDNAIAESQARQGLLGGLFDVGSAGIGAGWFG